jgi:hypothetical protein
VRGGPAAAAPSRGQHPVVSGASGLALEPPRVEPSRGETLEPAPVPPPRGWRLALAAGVYPPMLLGFAASALANRLAFAGWGLVAGIGHAALLRAAWQRGWSAAARAALTLAWAGLAMLSFAGLVQRHQEILDLGYRAVLWPVYAAALTQPLTWQLAAGALVAAAVVATGAARRNRSHGR